MTRGLTNSEIATQFGITVSGVKKHLNAIFAKFGAANRAEAVATALRRQEPPVALRKKIWYNTPVV